MSSVNRHSGLPDPTWFNIDQSMSPLQKKLKYIPLPRRERPGEGGNPLPLAPSRKGREDCNDLCG